MCKRALPNAGIGFPRSPLIPLLTLSLLHLGQVAAQVTNCSSYNVTKGPYAYGTSAANQHVSGDHAWANATKGICSYTGVAQVGATTACTPTSTASSNSGASDSGVTAPYWHAANFSDHGGLTDGAAGATPTADAEGAAAVSSCAVFPCGSPTITISGSGHGAGFQVSATGGTIVFNSSWHYSNTCTAYTLAALKAPSCALPTYPAPVVEQGFEAVWSPATCSWEIVPSGESPVVIDTEGNWGKRELFSDPSNGEYVSFDMRGDGSLEKFSWPKPDSGLAWLALDRDGDGVIKNGTELFGNFTAHADGGITDYPNPNGFIALAWYDQPTQGGDMNLILDERDAIWPKLRLWIDEHCYKEPNVPCQSLPDELHTLRSKGVTSISLVWDASAKVDAVGNEYKFYTVLNPEKETEPNRRPKDGHLAYDVWLKQLVP
jgi:hypothetical protein